MSKTVAVIVPYYQKQSGILQRALQSVIQQQLQPDVSVRIYVVDDQSPTPPTIDLDYIQTSFKADIRLLSRPNGGPGAARNMALQHLVGDPVDYVAFLDSDDAWEPTHLAEALGALETGATFYFCNHIRDAEYGNYFDHLPDFKNRLQPDQSVSSFAANALTDLFITECPPQTSTVIYRYDQNAGIRFIEELRGAGEDHVFWISLVTANATAVNADPLVNCMTGVNLYWSSLSWDNPKSIDRYGYLILFYLQLKSNGAVYSANSKRIDSKLLDYQFAYSYSLSRGIAKGFTVNGSLVRRIFEKAPATILMLPLRAAVAFLRRKDMMKNW